MPEPASFVSLLQGRILPYVHRVALLIAVTGLAFLILHYPGADQLLMIGFSTLSMTYFLMAFLPPVIPPDCKPDLYSAVVYKLAYIGCSVATIGILFQFLKLNGANEMLMIGTISVGVGLLASGLLIARNRDNWIVLKDCIIRGSVLFLLSVYMM